MIILKNIYYQYDSKLVLNDIHLSIKQKERIVILGINGCGKTTLLKILNALIFPQKGSYTYNDVLITEKKSEKRILVEDFVEKLFCYFRIQT
jgi:cobalt/nickel transport system ATP-binding protein